MSAGFLLFGIMTIWLPAVRAALFLYPLATISVLVCLGLIFKFAQAGGRVGLMTGGVLALYLIGVIVTDTQRQEAQVAIQQPSPEVLSKPAQPTTEPPRAIAPERPSTAALTPAAPPLAPKPREPRTLLVSKGAVLKFVAGVPYHLKVRAGFTTSLYASQGKVAFYAGDERVTECMDTLELPMRASASPYQEIDRTIRACGADAVLRVGILR